MYYIVHGMPGLRKNWKHIYQIVNSHIVFFFCKFLQACAHERLKSNIEKISLVGGNENLIS